MNYKEVLNYLSEKNKKKNCSKYDLKNTLEFQKYMDFADKNYSIIHVAGTNGKGSVSWKLATVLQNNEKRVGLYSSPHITTFRERFQVDGVKISEEEVESYYGKFIEGLPFLLKKECSYFELMTAFAFYYFFKKNVDIAVIETGLGGRLDSTNVVTPILSVITSIDFDHTSILGNSIEEIAYEKGGIIKENIPVVLGYHTPQAFLEKIAKEKKAPCFSVEEVGVNIEEYNQNTVKKCLDILEVFDQRGGIETVPPCRFERVSSEPSVILDVAHNPIALKKVIQRVNEQFPSKSIRLVFSLSKGKDGPGCVEVVRSLSPKIHLVSCLHERLLIKKELEHLFKNIAYESLTSIQLGLEKAIALAKENDEVVLVCGSFFIMSEVRAYFGLEEESSDDLNENFTFC